ncbi:MAG TPA: hypothetical protein VGS10_11405 [Terracidiphilus sp.]|nr:hypothetical protein [Terracidiphilus sp.]
MADPSLDRLIRSLRRAGWTHAEIAAICSSVPAPMLRLAIARADHLIGTEAMIAEIREALEPLNRCSVLLAAHVIDEAEALAMLDEVTRK